MEIRPYEKNAKKHPEKQVFQIAESVKRFGWQQPIVVDKDGVIIVGHGRFFAWKQYNLPEPPIQVASNLTPEEVMAYRLADNKLNESEWDMDLVLEDLRMLTDDLLELTGFSKDLLVEPEAKDDDVPETPEEPRTKRGDLYELGNHRILCGDSTSEDDMRTLMEGTKADMVFTDPPYNVDYKGSGANTSEGIMNDKMDDVSFGLFLTDAFKRMAEHTKRSAGCYIFHSHKTASQFEMALEATGFIIDTQLIWNKPAAGLGMNDYRTKHEPFFYCSLDKDKEFYGDRTGTTVWKVPKDEAKALSWYQKTQEQMEKGLTTVWSMQRANVSEYVHPTQKPVELPVTAILKSSKVDDVVLDQFLGSGTTLIAAHKTNRSCYGLELDPKFVDVVVQRWVNFTGNEEITRNGKPITWKKTEQKTRKTSQ
jgi:site-specific DNA-methyltransferase (adenine-specific)